jgi:protein required for attachment to host cells
MQQNNVTWVLVSDASRARIFAAADQGKVWSLVRELEHPESRLTNQELVSDRPGSIQQSGGPSGHRVANNPSKGNRSAMEPQTDPKTEEHILFARELADELEKGLHNNAYNHLILAAGPQFLGMLRSSLDNQVSKHVTASVDKDYTQLDPRKLQERFSGIVPE